MISGCPASDENTSKPLMVVIVLLFLLVFVLWRVGLLR
jgi:hypothetical protein